MKLVFQETPKFGDEHNVTQQIHTLDEQIQKFHDEIKRYEVKVNINQWIENVSFPL